ncbi:MAG: hypothetical protein ACJ739_01605 [Acidimicrobiales bacterium]
MRQRRADRAGLVAVVVVTALAAVLVLDRTSRLGFYNDEWYTILHRRSLGSGLFSATNGHLTLVPTALYQVLFAVFGLESYLPFRILLVCVQVGFGPLIFLYLRPRIGNLGAAVAAAALLYLGAAWEDLLWPQQLVFYLPLITTTATLLLVDRHRLGADVGATVCMLIGTASSAVGVPITIALTLELVRRGAFRRLWVPLVPLVLWILWYLGNGDAGSQGGGTAGGLGQVPRFVLRIAGNGGGALVGSGIDLGRVIVVGVFVAAVGVMVVRRTVPPRLVTVLTMPAIYWASVAWSRPMFDGVAATFSRYILPSAFFLVLLVAETLSELALPVRARAILAVSALVLFSAHSLAWNLDRLDEGETFLRTLSRNVHVRVGALELVRADLRDRSYLVQPDPFFTSFTAGEYLDAVDDLGSPAPSVDDLRRAERSDQRVANQVLLDVLGPELTPAPDLRPGRAEVAGEGVRVESTGPCTRVIPLRPGAHVTASGDQMDLDIVPLGTSFTVVGLDAFADGDADAQLGIVNAGAPMRLHLPPVAKVGPWTARFAPSGPVDLCGTT